MNGKARAMSDHDEIRRWVEERGGRPAVTRGTDLLRIDFPGFSGEDTLQEISWGDWFQKFEERELAFLYQEEKDGQESRFNKLVKRSSVDLGIPSHAHSKH
jgi:hypothetical protein